MQTEFANSIEEIQENQMILLVMRTTYLFMLHICLKTSSIFLLLHFICTINFRHLQNIINDKLQIINNRYIINIKTLLKTKINFWIVCPLVLIDVWIIYCTNNLANIKFSFLFFMVAIPRMNWRNHISANFSLATFFCCFFFG